LYTSASEAIVKNAGLGWQNDKILKFETYLDAPATKLRNNGNSDLTRPSPEKNLGSSLRDAVKHHGHS